jgi:hypothetical protein
MPRELLLRVDKTMTCTTLVFLVPLRRTERFIALGEYWSTVATRLPFTKTASFPLAGPATYHIRKVLRLTLKVADAPVREAVWNEPPRAVLLFAAVQIVVVAGELFAETASVEVGVADMTTTVVIATTPSANPMYLRIQQP